MKRIFRSIKKINKKKKLYVLIFVFIVTFLSITIIPSLARYKNRVISNGLLSWNGSIATSYKSGNGSLEDPYIISNGAELAYFSLKSSDTDYSNTYFELSNDIILNSGFFEYDINDKIKYLVNENEYYVSKNKYYDNVEKNGPVIGTLNIINSIKNFNGYFNGNSYRIFGMYINNQEDEEAALFTNLSGSVSNIYLENSIVYGGVFSGGIASKAYNSNLENIMYDGYVIGNNNIDTSQNINIIDNISSNFISGESRNINLNNTVPIGSEIMSTRITGEYSTNNDSLVVINNVEVSNGYFDLNLGTNILNDIPVEIINSDGNDNVTIENIKYIVSYKYAVSGGIIGVSTNINIKNCVNKATVNSYSISGGLIGNVISDLTIDQSYNGGSISSNKISGGLIGTINNNSNIININKSYNSGNVSSEQCGGLFGVINNSTSVVINNSFNVLNNGYSFDSIIDSSVTLNNSLYVIGSNPIKNGSVSGSFSSISLSNLKLKSTTLSNLKFDEFIDYDDLRTNPGNVWVYQNNSLPILYLDDVNSHILTLNVGTKYSWNNFSNELKRVVFTSNITFNLNIIDQINYKKSYYYISNTDIPLTLNKLKDVDWIEYSSPVQITNVGNYVIYIKVVDNGGNDSYINSDLLLLYKSGSSISITSNDTVWNNSSTNLTNYYIGQSIDATVNASNEYFDIKSIKYYISSNILTINELELLNTAVWVDYNDKISINDVGTYIIYIKVVDSSNYVTYANTDYIVFDGYRQTNINPGRKNTDTGINTTINITNDSSVTYNFTNTNYNAPTDNYVHNLVSNIILPLGTIITLIDNNNSQVFKYVVATNDYILSNNSYLYSLSNFYEIGTSSNTNYFNENDYYSNNEISEDYTITLNFSKTYISNNYLNVSISLGLYDLDSNCIRPTLLNTIKKFNLYSNNNKKANLYINTDFNDQILYNIDSVTDININTGIQYETINNIKVYDTLHEDELIGLSINVEDTNGNIVDKSHLKNLKFKINDIEYYPDNDNSVRINLNEFDEEINKVLSLYTTESSDTSLSNGTYHFVISPYISYDGIYYDTVSSEKISIPLIVSDTDLTGSYGFDVTTNDSRIINKTNTNSISFKINKSNNLSNPSVKVSLYKKNYFNPLDQTYSIVNLANYVTNSLTLYSNNSYNIPINQYNDFELNLSNILFEKNGYKFVFELYSGNKRIDTINKYFVVK